MLIVIDFLIESADWYNLNLTR